MENLPDFPIGSFNKWYNSSEISIPNNNLQDWLLDTGSLTVKLELMCNRFELSLLGHQNIDLELKKSKPFFIFPKDGSWVLREVILWGDGMPWVFAHSLICKALMDKKGDNFAEKSIGNFIFNDPQFVRSKFQLNYEKPPENLSKFLNPFIGKLWGRRSCFTTSKYAIIVEEIFLPQSPAYKTN